MTKYDKSVREAVFQLFSLGKPIERIAKEIGISKVTIYKWKDEEDWDSRANKIRAKARKELNETLTDIKKRQHSILKGMIGDFVSRLKKGEAKVDTKDIINILKHELHLMGEAESSSRIEGELSAEDFKKAYQEINETE
jgi:transposase